MTGFRVTIDGEGPVQQLGGFFKASLGIAQGRLEAQDLRSGQLVLVSQPVMLLGSVESLLGAPEIGRDPAGVAEIGPGESPGVFHQRHSIVMGIQTVRDLHGQLPELDCAGRVVEPRLADLLLKQVAECEPMEAHRLRPHHRRALRAGSTPGRAGRARRRQRRPQP